MANRNIPVVNGNSRFNKPGYRNQDSFYNGPQNLPPKSNSDSILYDPYHNHPDDSRGSSHERYFSPSPYQDTAIDSAQTFSHTPDRRIPIMNRIEQNHQSASDRRIIAVRGNGQSEHDIFRPNCDQRRASSYTSSSADESYAHMSRSENFAPDKSRYSQRESATRRDRPSPNRYYSIENRRSNSRNFHHDKKGNTYTSNKSKSTPTEPDSPLRKTSSTMEVQAKTTAKLDQEIHGREKTEKEKKKELQRARRMHRKLKRNGSLKQTNSVQQNKDGGSDTELEDEPPSESSSPKKMKKDHDGNNCKRNNNSQSSNESSKKKSVDSGSKKTQTTNSNNKYTTKNWLSLRIPFLEDGDSHDTTVEEGELKSSESSQCDEVELEKRKTDILRKLEKENAHSGTCTSVELRKIEELTKQNAELEKQVKDVNFELVSRKKALERQTKDHETKVENLEEFYHDELEALRKEITYLKKDNDHERDMTDAAKTKERDLLNKVRRLEDSLLHSGKENLDLQEKLKRVTSENDMLRFGSSSYQIPVNNFPPNPHPPAQTQFRFPQHW